MKSAICLTPQCRIMYNTLCCGETQHRAPLAQLDRVSDYESEGLGFESLMARQRKTGPKGLFFLRAYNSGSPVTHYSKCVLYYITFGMPLFVVHCSICYITLYETGYKSALLVDSLPCYNSHRNYYKRVTNPLSVAFTHIGSMQDMMNRQFSRRRYDI